jgi:hypothetical protein
MKGFVTVRNVRFAADMRVHEIAAQQQDVACLPDGHEHIHDEDRLAYLVMLMLT